MINSIHLNNILNNSSTTKKLKNLIEGDKCPFYFKVYNENKVNVDGISIAMTVNNRTTQLLFTLDTINKSNYKNIQVVIVDDSQEKICDDTFEKYPFRIDYIYIDNVNKYWVNPCINYNIAFNKCVCDRIIIQNSEICHVGDVINYVNLNLVENTYLIFDVISIPSFEDNENIYSIGNDTVDVINYCKDKFHDTDRNKSCTWFQHHHHNNKGYHFLTAINKVDLVKLNGFDYDYCMGSSYDDDDFIYRIKNFKYDVIAVDCDIEQVLGLHQYHESGILHHYSFYVRLNDCIFQLKCLYYEKYNEWIQLSEISTKKELVEIITSILF